MVTANVYAGLYTIQPYYQRIGQQLEALSRSTSVDRVLVVWLRCLRRIDRVLRSRVKGHQRKHAGHQTWPSDEPGLKRLQQMLRLLVDSERRAFRDFMMFS
jgi:hypothetical protein